MKIIPIFLLFFQLSIGLMAQQKKVYLTDILEEAIFSKKEIIGYNNVNISLDNIEGEGYYDTKNLAKHLKNKYPDIPLDKNGKIIISSGIRIWNSSGIIKLSGFSFTSELEFYSSQISDKEQIQELQFESDSCDFLNGLTIRLEESNVEYFTMTNCNIYQSIDIRLISSKALSPYFTFYRNVFEFGQKKVARKDFNPFDSDYYIDPYIETRNFTSYIVENTFKYVGKAFEDEENGDYFDKTKVDFGLYNNSVVDFEDNKFISTAASLSRSSFQDLRMTSNDFEGSLYLNEVTILDRATITNNNFKGGLDLSRTLLPELYVQFDWNQLKGNKLFVNVDQSAEEAASGFKCRSCLEYHGISIEELAREDRFLQLILVYTKLYRINKENGDIVSANGAYVELQDLYTKRYEYLVQAEGGLENWFRWRLNQLLEYYVVYGTAPARALVVSFYIILTFSVFYFFFPSEWDVTSKKQLIEQTKLTLSKKHKQVAIPLLKTLWLFALSFVNAFTLSINSFVTLGFGTIPTTGLARYVCIIQGFLGWFLLSLFTVALINQVIF